MNGQAQSTAPAGMSRRAAALFDGCGTVARFDGCGPIAADGRTGAAWLEGAGRMASIPETMAPIGSKSSRDHRARHQES
jgi:hypothetical protein